MNVEDFGSIACMTGGSSALRANRLMRRAAGLEPFRQRNFDEPVHDVDLAYKSAPGGANQRTGKPSPNSVALAVVGSVFLVLIASVFVSGVVSAAVLVGLFGIPYIAFLIVYPAVVTLSSLLRALPPLVALSRAKRDRAALLIGGAVGALLVLPATYYLARWGVQSFGLFLPAAAKDGAYIAWNLNMAVDMRSVPDWMRQSAPFVSMAGAVIGLLASARARNRAGRTG